VVGLGKLLLVIKNRLQRTARAFANPVDLLGALLWLKRPVIGKCSALAPFVS